MSKPRKKKGGEDKERNRERDPSKGSISHVQWLMPVSVSSFRFSMVVGAIRAGEEEIEQPKKGD